MDVAAGPVAPRERAEETLGAGAASSVPRGRRARGSRVGWGWLRQVRARVAGPVDSAAAGGFGGRDLQALLGTPRSVGRSPSPLLASLVAGLRVQARSERPFPSRATRREAMDGWIP